ncbi:ThuA-like domain-containing protein [Mrakia frigida]|uniref:ThuA domain-containing protein n=1 Tax=Mrakia frigida TaxID=29902 RepID=UPI003FCBF97F
MSASSVLVYTRTEDFRHESIPNAISALKGQSQQYQIDFTFSEDRELFTIEGLACFDAILFLHNSGEVLTESGKAALLSFLEKGGALVGVHAGCACLFGTDFFRRGMGALFDFHPKISTPTFIPLNRSHPSMKSVPDRWTFEEEVYHFRSDPRAVGGEVLLTVDPDSFDKSGNTSSDPSFSMGPGPHPIAWFQTHNAAVSPSSSSPPAGRSFFTALGHTKEIWEDPIFLEHVMEGIKWAVEKG